MNKDYDTIVGHVLIERGIVSRDQLVECLREAGGEGSSASTAKLTDLLITKGYLEETQLSALRLEIGGLLDSKDDFQVVRREDTMIGRLLVQRKSITEQQLKECLAAQDEEAKEGGRQVSRLGELMIKRGFCSFADLEAALKAQAAQVKLVCAQCSATVASAEFDPNKKYICKKCSGMLLPEDAKRGAQPGDSTGVPRGGAEVPEAAQRAMRNPKNQFGKYWLVKELGRGGMGAVYQAWDTSLNRMVAIKVLLTQRSQDEVERFLREAQTAANLRHPNIIGIYETGKQDGRFFISMEYIEGDQLGSDRLPIRKACDIVRTVALALDIAHQKDIIHRDIKPQNIMLDKKGIPHVMDFGLAKSLSAESAITVTGTIIGTPSYMPPEQAEGKIHRLDRRVDIYSLGAVLYELLTGRPPFKGATPVETLKQVLDDDPMPPSKINPAVPRDVENIVLKCLEKDRANRYQTAAALGRDLSRYLEGEAVSARSMNVVERAAKKVKRNKAIYAAAAVLVVVPVIAVLLYLSSSSQRAGEVDQHFTTASDLFKAKKYVAAKAEFTAAMALDDTDPRLAAWIKKCDDAIAELKKAADEATAAAGKEAAEKKRREAQVRKEFDDRIQAGDARVAAKDWESARVEYEKALSVGKEFPEAKGVEAKLSSVKTTIAEIAELKRKELEQLQASDAERSKKLAEAQRDYDSGRQKLETADRDLYKPGADMARQQKLAGEAVECFSRALGIYARHHEALLLRGRAHALRYEYAEAIQDYSQAIDIMKTFASAYWERGRLYLQLYLDAMTSRGWRGFAQSEGAVGLLRKALPDLTEAKRLGLGDDTDLAEAFLAYANDNMEETIRLCDRVLAKNDSKEEAWKLKGDAIYRGSLRNPARDALASAVEAYTKAIQNRVNYPDAYIMRGAIQFELGQPDAAAADFQKAIAINPKNSWAHNAIAIYYLRQRDNKNAMDHFTKAVELDKGAPRAWADRAELKLMQRDWSGALEDAETAIKVNPEYAMGWHARGIARAQLGKIREAIPDLEKAIELGHPARQQLEKNIEQLKKQLGD